MAYKEYYRVFLDEPWPMTGDKQSAGQSTDGGGITTDPGDIISLENDPADDPEEEDSQPLLCTELLATANSDEPDLSEDDCVENTGNDMTSATDVASTTQIAVDQPSNHNTDSNIQQEPKQPAVQRDARCDVNECDPAKILQTKLAQSVSKILGVSLQVKTLNKARKALQQNQGSTYYQSKYQDTLACIQTQVLSVFLSEAEAHHCMWASATN